MDKTAAQRAYHNFQKHAVSRELAQRALFSKALREGLDDITAPAANPGTVDRVRALLKGYKRTIRKAGPEAQRLIYGPPAIELQMPESLTAHIWEPDVSVLRGMK